MQSCFSLAACHEDCSISTDNQYLAWFNKCCSCSAQCRGLQQVSQLGRNACKESHLPWKTNLGLQSLEEKVSWRRGQDQALPTAQPWVTEMGGMVKVATPSLESFEDTSAMPCKCSTTTKSQNGPGGRDAWLGGAARVQIKVTYPKLRGKVGLRAWGPTSYPAPAPPAARAS